MKIIEEKYLECPVVKSYNRYKKIVQPFTDIRGIVILIDLIICVLIAYLLIFFELRMLKAVDIVLFLPSIFYFIYHQTVKLILKSKEPEYPLNLEPVIKKAKLEDEYFSFEVFTVYSIYRLGNQANESTSNLFKGKTRSTSIFN